MNSISMFTTLGSHSSIPIVAVANIGKRRSAIRGDLGVRGNRRE